MKPRRQWKSVLGYKGRYLVSNHGHVFSFLSDKMLKPNLALGGGYRAVSLSNGKTIRKRKVCHLVLEAFVGPRPRGMECCHGPRGKQYDMLSNLCWGTKSKNLGEDRVRDGTIPRGENHGAHKLSSGQVFRIKKMLSEGMGVSDIADIMNIPRYNVKNIKSGLAWSWLNPPKK